MKSLSLVFLLAAFLPVCAQQPPPLQPPPLPPQSPQPPVKLPPNFPFDMFEKMGGGGGFLELRRKPPFRAVIEKKSVTPETFSVTLKTPQGTSSYTETTTNPDALKVVKRLVVGREYQFPKIFDDVLGKNSSASAPLPVRHVPGVEDLTKGPPFRARVVKLEVTADTVAWELHCVDGQRVTLRHTGSVPQQKEARRIASLLKEGETYEFPHAVLAETAGKTAEPSSEMKVLKGFVGGWEMPLKEEPGGKAIVHYVWKQDGKGLWRETWEEPEKERNNRRAAWLITYDPERQCYLETLTSPGLNPHPIRELEMRWVPETKAQVFRGTSNKPVPGTQVIGRRKLVSPDHLEWDFSYIKPDGSPATQTSGAYDRVKR